MQTKKQSFVEACVQTLVAFTISVLIQPHLYALWGFHITLADSAVLAGIFTLISLVRSYIIRRMFNWQHLKKSPGTEGFGQNAQTEKPGSLNPEFPCWLMGIPKEWVSSIVRGMQSCRK